MGGLAGRLAEDRPDIDEEVQPEPHCPIPWRPNALAPVFAGTRHYGPTRPDIASLSFDFGNDPIDRGAPVPMDIWFPTIDGSPASAEILATCGPYPLVIFAHGGCYVPGSGIHPQELVYRDWAQSRMVRQQARAGYVVVVPRLRGVPGGSDDDLEMLRRVVGWVRSDWVHAGLLAPQSALVGHSRGGVHGARLVAEGGFGAFIALSGEFNPWFADDLHVLESISRPKLFIYGSAEQQTLLDPSWALSFEGDPRPPGTWGRVKVPKHEAFIDQMSHYDYLVANGAGCSGSNAMAADVTADLVTMFLGRCVPPPSAGDLAARIPEVLYLPDWDAALTPLQASFSGAYLAGFAAMQSRRDFRVALSHSSVPGVEVAGVLAS